MLAVLPRLGLRRDVCNGVTAFAFLIVGLVKPRGGGFGVGVEAFAFGVEAHLVDAFHVPGRDVDRQVRVSTVRKEHPDAVPGPHPHGYRMTVGALVVKGLANGVELLLGQEDVADVAELGQDDGLAENFELPGLRCHQQPPRVRGEQLVEGLVAVP